jgi:hypothetical protein
MEQEVGLARRISDQLAQRVTMEQIGVNHVAANGNGGEHVAAIKAKEWTAEEREVRRKNALASNQAQHLHPGVYVENWTDEEIALLGQFPDTQVARQTERTVEAVRCKRVKLGLSNPTTTHWNAEGIALLGTMPDTEVAMRLGRSVGSITQKRCKLGIPTARDGRPVLC